MTWRRAFWTWVRESFLPIWLVAGLTSLMIFVLLWLAAQRTPH